eukprot:CAMPEP_0197852968 /NCGR_PEP_ID=MMETSP1438-20131217/21858_1 /TAXON_ID=1461541 /ORGANISM="Pterosperma sp., Strain CCMP1384" /LENGTH=549 /DNA_ID=CAMNT_0043467221 /DNA_START=182 /DNA_END=1828 /DNA_ORIENTATION=+
MDRYILGKRIGEGSFGKVYLAKDTKSMNENVVVKMVQLPANKREREECLKEINYLTELHHPYLAYCKDSFVDKGQLAIVMPFYSGGDLSSVIKKNKQRNTRVPEEVVLEWLAQLMLAAEHLHSRKMLHRDIKADNIFMSTCDRPSSAGAPVKRVSVLLGDFGIARVLEYSNAKARTQCGTPYYMSPELFKGTPYNHKSDIWGLGVVLYELMALQVPFTAQSMSGLGNAVMKTNPKPLPNNYSGVLRQLVMSMLSKNPTTRPSAADILRHPLLKDKVSDIFDQQHTIADHFQPPSENLNPFNVAPPSKPNNKPPAGRMRRRSIGDPLSRSLGAIPEALSESKRSVAVASSVSNQRERIGAPSTPDSVLDGPGPSRPALVPITEDHRHHRNAANAAGQGPSPSVPSSAAGGRLPEPRRLNPHRHPASNPAPVPAVPSRFPAVHHAAPSAAPLSVPSSVESAQPEMPPRIPLLKARADQAPVAPDDPMPKRFIRCQPSPPSAEVPYNRPPVSRRVNDLIAPQVAPPVGRLPRRRNIYGGVSPVRRPVHKREW